MTHSRQVNLILDNNPELRGMAGDASLASRSLYALQPDGD
jgi:hypothetical protein